VQGAALADIPMLCGFEVDITEQIVSGQRLVLDPASRTLTVP
jgi:predicted aconitase with swiveling domain